MNTISPLPENKWYDAGDKRFKPGNILINPRNIDTLFIVDKETKKIVWEWTHDYKGGLSHCHEPEMIEKGLSGAGNIILFDNGNTYIAEDNKGRLFQVKPDGDIVWEYVNRGGTTRPSVIPYDFTPQLRSLPKPGELKVTPPNNLEWHIKPDKFRE